MTDQQLMTAIKSQYGAYIAAAVAGTPFSEAFVAALTANEGALNPAATRLEPKVFTDLVDVIIGKKANYGAIGAQDLMNYVWPMRQKSSNSDPEPVWGLPQALTGIRNMASSWGPTQIMGYQTLAGKYSLGDLADPKKHFPHTVEMLDDFQARFHLQGIAKADGIAADFFRCWNTGSPSGKTFDPQYVGSGIIRMQLYAALP